MLGGTGQWIGHRRQQGHHGHHALHSVADGLGRALRLRQRQHLVHICAGLHQRTARGLQALHQVDAVGGGSGRGRHGLPQGLERLVGARPRFLQRLGARLRHGQGIAQRAVGGPAFARHHLHRHQPALQLLQQAQAFRRLVHRLPFGGGQAPHQHHRGHKNQGPQQVEHSTELHEQTSALRAPHQKRKAAPGSARKAAPARCGLPGLYEGRSGRRFPGGRGLLWPRPPGPPRHPLVCAQRTGARPPKLPLRPAPCPLARSHAEASGTGRTCPLSVWAFSHLKSRRLSAN